MASKNYIQNETPKVWTDAGGDKLLDLGGLASGAVACGAYLDLGAAPRCDVYQVEMFIDGFDTAPTVGRTVDLFFTQSEDGTNFDGVPTTAPTSSTQGTVTGDQTRNLLYAGSLAAYSTTAGLELRGRFVVRLTSRYVAPVVFNRVDDPLLSTSDAHKITLTPIPYESQ